MEIKIATYNIDGLPESLDLRQLPWPLKPFAWLYKAFKGTTLITVNDNKNKAAMTKEIGHRLSELGADIVAVQEDFNYHTELMENMPFYKACKHLGGITVNNLRWFPYPRFKADGLNIINDMGLSLVTYEHIETWKKSHGYFRHANDKLTMKGFRHYVVSFCGVRMNVIIVHMDADFYDSVKHPNVTKDIVARRSQFEQLADYVNKDKHNNLPLIVMGDFNSYPKYEWDKENIDYFLSLVPDLELAVPENNEDCDHIFVRGINVKRCYFDMSFGSLSDHKPLIAELEL